MTRWVSPRHSPDRPWSGVAGADLGDLALGVLVGSSVR